MYKRQVLITSFFAFCTALFGLVLSRESGYDNELVEFHKWWGVATAYIIYFLSLLNTEKTFFKIGLAASVLTLIVGSHLGLSLIHIFLLKLYASILESYKSDVEKYAKNESQKLIIRHIIDTAAYEVDHRIQLNKFGGSSFNSREIKAVSYTHLDVYKRQE